VIATHDFVLYGWLFTAGDSVDVIYKEVWKGYMVPGNSLDSL
jgi:hypothetical protein